MAVKREGYPEDVPVHEGAPSKGLNLMTQPAHTLTIMYPVMLVNLLPCDLSYQVKNTPAKGNIKAGKSVPLYTVSTMFCPFTFGSKGWRSGESARLPPMWPGFKSRRRRHMWVEFVVGSLPCSERFFSGYSGFPLSSKTNISKFQFDQESGRRRTTL